MRQQIKIKSENCNRTPSHPNHDLKFNQVSFQKEEIKEKLLDEKKEQRPNNMRITNISANSLLSKTLFDAWKSQRFTS